MSLEFESLADRFHHKNIVPIKDTAKGAEKTDLTKKKKQPIFLKVEKEITQIAGKIFEMTNKAYHMMKIAHMKIPDSKVIIAVDYSMKSKSALDIFSFIAKEGIYAKHIKEMAKQTEDELETNRLEKRIEKHRKNLDQQFRAYIQKLKRKK